MYLKKLFFYFLVISFFTCKNEQQPDNIESDSNKPKIKNSHLNNIKVSNTNDQKQKENPYSINKKNSGDKDNQRSKKDLSDDINNQKNNSSNKNSINNTKDQNKKIEKTKDSLNDKIIIKQAKGKNEDTKTNTDLVCKLAMMKDLQSEKLKKIKNIISRIQGSILQMSKLDIIHSSKDYKGIFGEIDQELKELIKRNKSNDDKLHKLNEIKSKFLNYLKSKNFDKSKNEHKEKLINLLYQYKIILFNFLEQSLNIKTGLNVCLKCSKCHHNEFKYIGTKKSKDNNDKEMNYFDLTDIPNRICPYCKNKVFIDKLLFKNCKYKLAFTIVGKQNKEIIEGEINDKIKVYDFKHKYNSFKIYIDAPFYQDDLNITEIIRKKYGECTKINEDLVYNLAIKKDFKYLNLLLQHTNIKKVLYKNKYITDFKNLKELAQNLIKYYSSIKPGLNVHGHCKNCNKNLIKSIEFNNEYSNSKKKFRYDAGFYGIQNCPSCNKDKFYIKYHSIYKCKAYIKLCPYGNKEPSNRNHFYINASNNYYIFDPANHCNGYSFLQIILYDPKIKDTRFNENFDIKKVEFRNNSDKQEYEGSTIAPGLNMKGKCVNSKCKHYNKYIWKNLGFDYGYNDVGIKNIDFCIPEFLICPNCKTGMVIDVELLFYKCGYYITGYKATNKENKEKILGECKKNELHVLIPKC